MPNGFLNFPDQKATLIVAVSGGPDSVFLLHQCLLSLPACKLVVAHVNHKTRDTQSDDDEAFVRKLAQTLQLPFETISKSFQKQSGNFEENARRFRYEFFEKIRKKHRADWILTAHHLNDQIETVLFNMARGATLSGFRGIDAQDEKRHLLRPMLHISKKEILLYLHRHKLQFRHDASNEDTDYSRNRIRQNIIPEFEKINAEFIKVFARSWRKLSSNLDFIEATVNEWITQHCETKGLITLFDLETFLLLPEVMRQNILNTLFHKINKRGLLEKQCLEINHTLGKRKNGLRKEFGRNAFIKIQKNIHSGKRSVVITRDSH